MAFVLAFSKQPLGLWCQSNALSHGRAPEVVHPLRVFGKPHQAILFALVVHNNLGTVARHDGDIFPVPGLFLKNLKRSHLAPLHCPAETLAGIHHRQSCGCYTLQESVRVCKPAAAITQQVQLGLFPGYMEVFSNPNILFGHPACGIVTSAAVRKVGTIVSVWVHFLENGLAQQCCNKATLGI